MPAVVCRTPVQVYHRRAIAEPVTTQATPKVDSRGEATQGLLLLFTITDTVGLRKT